MSACSAAPARHERTITKTFAIRFESHHNQIEHSSAEGEYRLDRSSLRDIFGTLEIGSAFAASGVIRPGDFTVRYDSRQAWHRNFGQRAHDAARQSA